MNVLITGGCGDVGGELTRRLAARGNSVLALDLRAAEFAAEEFGSGVRLVSADVRDADCMRDCIDDVDVVIHAAALKDVVECERDPVAAYDTNLRGTANVISAANHAKVSKFLLVSTDKAASPSSVMGASKLSAERLVEAISAREGGMSVAAVRLGNVLGSAGSVLPCWVDRAMNGEALAVTDPRMTRFVMSLERATEFVWDAALSSRSGEVCVPSLPSVRLADLTEAFARVLLEEAPGCPTPKFVTTGIRPGEKLHEEMFADTELMRVCEDSTGYRILPSSRSVGVNRSSRVRSSLRSDQVSPLLGPMLCEAIRGAVRRCLKSYDDLRAQGLRERSLHYSSAVRSVRRDRSDPKTTFDGPARGRARGAVFGLPDS